MIMNQEGTPINNDPNQQYGEQRLTVEQAAKDQIEARTTVIEASDRIPAWEPMNANVPDNKSANKGARYEDAMAVGYSKQPDTMVHPVDIASKANKPTPAQRKNV